MQDAIGSEPDPTRTRRRRRLGCALAGLAPLLLALFVWRPLLATIPPRLEERGEPGVADALVVLAGDHTGARVEQAAALFQAGCVPSGPLVVSGGPIYERLTWAELMRDQAIRLGVDRGRIVLQDRSRTTTEDADLSAPLLQGCRRVIVVTSPFHSRRAAAEFRRALGPGVEVVSCPSRDATPTEWWRDPVAARAVVSELLKWVYPG